MTDLRLAICLSLAFCAAADAHARRADCENVPSVPTNKVLSAILADGDLGGRPYRLVHLLPVSKHGDYMNSTVRGQAPRYQDENNDVIQLTAGEAMHLVVKPLGGSGTAKGGGASTTTWALTLALIVSLAGWFATWKKLKAKDLGIKKDS